MPDAAIEDRAEYRFLAYAEGFKPLGPRNRDNGC
jgi:hypothetical protein